MGDEQEVSCDHQTGCTTEVLDDGTRVAFTKSDRPHAYYTIDAQRPDGYVIGVEATWSNERPAPALTDAQWLQFATAFTY
ncbi:hypothetical protein [Actinophytocola sp.]|uniref:hypothetical protein n=1 Tax=Actinophytocola sp. TaxID=1872138 RepID=UPI00389B1B31